MRFVVVVIEAGPTVGHVFGPYTEPAAERIARIARETLGDSRVIEVRRLDSL